MSWFRDLDLGVLLIDTSKALSGAHPQLVYTFIVLLAANAIFTLRVAAIRCGRSHNLNNDDHTQIEQQQKGYVTDEHDNDDDDDDHHHHHYHQQRQQLPQQNRSETVASSNGAVKAYEIQLCSRNLDRPKTQSGSIDQHKTNGDDNDSDDGGSDSGGGGSSFIPPTCRRTHHTHTQSSQGETRGVIYTAVAASLITVASSASSSASSASSSVRMMSLQTFQYRYLLPFLCASAADWLKGAYIYSIYETYGYNAQQITLLFGIGYAAGAVVGMAIGNAADRFGRRRLCMMYGVMQTISCGCVMYNSLPLLIFGRISSGVATATLSTCFETWMVSEHYRLGFTAQELSSTFASSAFLNSCTAIASGVMGQLAANMLGLGLRGPFVASACFAAVSLILCQAYMTESYGGAAANATKASSSGCMSFARTINRSMQVVWQDSSLLALAILQTLFESSMYLFVLQWTPSLEQSTMSMTKAVTAAVVTANDHDLHRHHDHLRDNGQGHDEKIHDDVAVPVAAAANAASTITTAAGMTTADVTLIPNGAFDIHYLKGLEQARHHANYPHVALLQEHQQQELLLLPALQHQPHHQEQLQEPALFPYGLIFALFMLSCMLGSSASAMRMERLQGKKDDARLLIRFVGIVFGVSSLALFISTVTHSFPMRLGSYLVFEACCGAYFPSQAKLRSYFIPESKRGGIMSVFRIPLNLVVVMVMATASDWPPSSILRQAAFMLLLAMIIAFRFKPTRHK